MGYNTKSYYKFLAATASVAVVSSMVAPNVMNVQAATNQFSDVVTGAYYHNAVQELVNRGVISGFSDGTFRPQEQITRGQAAKMFSIALGLDTKNAKDPGFKDVPTNKWYYGSIAALVNAGVISGFNDNTFRPNDTLTRSQMSKMVTLGFNFTENKAAASPFNDVSQSAWFAGYVGALLDNKITTGKTKTTFAPNEIVNRGQVAAFIYRSLNKTEGIGTSGVIEKITNSTVVISGKSYSMAENIKSLLNTTNQSALKNANISFKLADSTTISKITYLEITTSGQAATPEYSGHVVLDGQNAVINGNVKISADYVTVKNLKVAGNFEIGNELQNSFYSDNLIVSGKTIVSDNKSISAQSLSNHNSFYKSLSLRTSLQQYTAQAEKKTIKIIFENAKLSIVEVNKDDAAIEAKGETTLLSLSVASNASINAAEGVVIPKITLQIGAQKVEINASVTELTVDSIEAITLTGKANIENVTVNTSAPVNLNTTGQIKKVDATNKDAQLTVGKDAKVKDITLPEGSKVENIIKNFDDVKGNFENVGGVKNPDAVTPPAVGGGSSGNSGQSSVISVSDVSVTNATTITVTSTMDGLTFKLGSTPLTAVKTGTGTYSYVITIPVANALQVGMNNITVVKSNYSNATVIANYAGTAVTTSEGLTTAIATATAGDTIILTNDISTTLPTLVNKAVTIDGRGKKLTLNSTATTGESTAQGLGINANATIKNLVVTTNANTLQDNLVEAYGFGVTAVLENVTIKDSAKAGMTVLDGAKVVLKGSTELTNNAWGGVEVEDVSGSNLEFATGSTLSYAPSSSKLIAPAVWIDAAPEDASAYVTDTAGVLSDAIHVGSGENEQIWFNSNKVTYNVSNAEELQTAIDSSTSNDVINLLSDISSTSPIQVNKVVTIDGHGKKLTLNSTATTGETTAQGLGINANATIKNLVVTTNANTLQDNLVEAYGSGITAVLENVTIKDSAKAGMTVLDGAKVVLKGSTELTNNAWGGVEVEDVSGSNLEFATGSTLSYAPSSSKLTAPAVWIDAAPEDASAYVTDTAGVLSDAIHVGNGENEQIWFNSNKITYNVSNAEELQTAIDSSTSNDVINLLSDISSTSPIQVNKVVTIDGHGKKLTLNSTATTGESTAQGLGINANATIKNLVVTTNANTLQDNLVEAYGSGVTAVLENVTIKDSAKAGMTVLDGAKVVLKGSTELINNAWGGVEVENVSGSNLEFTTGSSLSYAPSSSKLTAPAVWIDAANLTTDVINLLVTDTAHILTEAIYVNENGETVDQADSSAQVWWNVLQ